MPYTPAEVLARAAFYPSLFYTYVTTKVTKRKWYSRIDRTVLIGALPVKSLVEELIEEEGVKGVVSVTEEYETRGITPSAKKWQEMGVQQLQIPTTDLTGTPSQSHIQAAVGFILSHRANNNSVYVHCKAGRTRSATVAACYLVKVHKWTPEEAVAFLKSRRPQVWLRDKQMKSVAMFYDSCRNSPSFQSPSASSSTASSASSEKVK
ncbi:hypothetical protein BaRGS_00035589 [Batillaria attramentaria]|uniref:Phosphatidylglycerophosphatase and protein-tyrosine phosphatase 1 n=1 Tax=Batillaria attramentaria TaxID=370345 RepID=A0ABD0JEA4_9CAEN